MIYEGYRNVNDHSEIVVSGAVNSNIDFPKPKTTKTLPNCNEPCKLMDYVNIREQQPLPLLCVDSTLPPEREKAYLQGNFEQRNKAAKTRVMIDIDQVRPINKRAPVPVMMPTQSGLEDWKEQSKKLAQTIQQAKEAQRSAVSQDHKDFSQIIGPNPSLLQQTAQDYLLGPSPKEQFQGNQRQRSHAVQVQEQFAQTQQIIKQIDPVNQLKPEQKQIPQISLHPLFQDEKEFKTLNYCHVPKPVVEKKERSNLLLMQQKTRKNMQDQQQAAAGGAQGAGQALASQVELKHKATAKEGKPDKQQEQKEPQTAPDNKPEIRARSPQTTPFNPKVSRPMQYLRNNHGHRFQYGSKEEAQSSYQMVDGKRQLLHWSKKYEPPFMAPPDAGERLIHDVTVHKKQFLNELKDEGIMREEEIPLQTGDPDQDNAVDETKYNILNTRQIQAIQKRHNLLRDVALSRRSTAKARRNEIMDQRWTIQQNSTLYPGDIRKQLHEDEEKAIKRQKASSSMNQKSQEKFDYTEMINMQDNWQKFKQVVENDLSMGKTALDTCFSLANDRRSRVAYAANTQYLPKSTKSENRVTRVERIGMQLRAELRKEDLGILAYMRRQGLEKEENMDKPEETIKSFRKFTGFHPQLLVKPKVEQPVTLNSAGSSRTNLDMTEPTSEKKEEAPKTTTADDVAQAVKDEQPAQAEPVDAEKLANTTTEQAPAEQQKNAKEDSGPQTQIQSEKSINNANTPAQTNKKDVNKVSTRKLQNDSVMSKSTVNDFSPSQRNNKSSSKHLDDAAVMKSINAYTQQNKPFNPGVTTNVYMDSDFWYHKGVVLNNGTNDQAPVQCYLQALKINKKHLPSIFNLACKYQQLGEYEKARDVFQQAIDVNPQWADALYGLCLVNIKLGFPKEAVKYIQKAIQIEGPNAKPHIKYALALAHRSAYDWDNALVAYGAIMKNEENIHEYRKTVNAHNAKIMEDNLEGSPEALEFKIDLYSHFQEMGLVRKYVFDVNLWPYFDKYEGWNLDEIDKVVSLLSKVRFFNRFDSDTLRMMLGKVTLRRIEKNQMLFFKGEEAAILVAGKLHLLSHEDSLDTPYVATTYSPGDAIGLDIDNEWSDAQHSWICAWETCDVLMISDGYLEYMWEKMKRFSSNLIADIIDQAPILTEMSEQTLFTLAHDVVQFKDYKPGEVICKQDNNSIYNIDYNTRQYAAIKGLKSKDDVAWQAKNAKFKINAKPRTKNLWNTAETLQEFKEVAVQVKHEKAKQFMSQREQGMVGMTMGDDEDVSAGCLSEKDGAASTTNTAAAGGQQNLRPGKTVNLSNNNLSLPVMQKKQSKTVQDPKLTSQLIKAEANLLIRNDSFAPGAQFEGRTAEERKKLDLTQLEQLKAHLHNKIKTFWADLEETCEMANDLRIATINKIEQYKRDKDQLPTDADGIYILIEGEAKVVNRKHPDATLKVLGQNEYFGESKFIQQQGYSYFGDIIASAPDVGGKALSKENTMGAGGVGTKVKWGANKDKGQPKNNEDLQVKAPINTSKDKNVSTTCLFLPADKLYLIPFYDLALLRGNKRAKKRVFHLRQNAGVKYRDNIRNLNTLMRGQ